jgi:hypothetical protein
VLSIGGLSRGECALTTTFLTHFTTLLYPLCFEQLDAASNPHLCINVIRPDQGVSRLAWGPCSDKSADAVAHALKIVLEHCKVVYELYHKMGWDV